MQRIVGWGGGKVTVGSDEGGVGWDVCNVVWNKRATMRTNCENGSDNDGDVCDMS